jgi:hypothetical protein
MGTKPYTGDHIENIEQLYKLNVATYRDISPCSPYVNRCFGGTYHFHLQGTKSAEQETSVQRVPRYNTSSKVF